MGSCWSKKKTEIEVPDLPHYSKMGEIENIVFSGGGANGIVHTGGYKALWKAGIMENAKRFGGSSIGAIFATLAALRINPARIEEEILNTDFTKFKDTSSIFEGYTDLILKFGFYNGNELSEWLSNVLNKYGGSDKLTFEGLYLLKGTELIITSCNINYIRIEYYNHIEYPSLSIKEAILRSMAVPFEYSPQKDQLGCLMIDGGFGDNYPLGYWDTETELGKTIGLKIYNPNIENQDGPNTIGFPIEDLRDYITGIMIMGANLREKDAVKRTQKFWERSLKLTSPGRLLMDFEYTINEKINCIERAYQDALIEIRQKVGVEVGN